MKKLSPNSVLLFGSMAVCVSSTASAQDVLPFPSPPMGGRSVRRMQESVHKWREQSSHLPEDAPNILIVMLDDAGFGHPGTFGGEISTPTLSRLAKEGISYNAFHTTAMCSPTRAALLTGRNHHRVGFGHDHRTRYGLGRLHRRHPEVAPRPSPRCSGTMALRPRPSASDTTRRSTRHANGPFDRIADRPRLRLLLRLPRRRDLPVGAAPVGEHQRRSRRRTSKTTRTTTSPRTWPTRPSPGCTATSRSIPIIPS